MRQRLAGWLLLPAVLLFVVGCVHSRPAIQDRSTSGDLPFRVGHPPGMSDGSPPLIYWSQRIGGSEPVTFHALRADLTDRRLEIISVIAEDPDGGGPAEACLTGPLELARRARAVAAVNANGFAGLPDGSGKRDERWREKLPVDIRGVAIHAGIWRSRPERESVPNVSFGITRRGRPFIGPIVDEPGDIVEAVNAWSFDLVDRGNPVPQAGGDRHPRTAVGFDRSRRWLYLVVVDGRQPDYSVGMTARELADLMAHLGADRATNLDGGGSSILLVAARDDALNIVNRPSGGQPRPVPVLLGIRRKKG
jgi:hypothetical protein